MKRKEIEAKLISTLAILGEAKPLLPKNVLLPALGGYPGAEIPGAEPGPVYGARARRNIQGNIIPGFNKDHQHFLFFRSETGFAPRYCAATRSHHSLPRWTKCWPSSGRTRRCGFASA